MYIERKSNKIKTLFFIEQKSKINPKRKFKQKERSSPNKKVSERAKQKFEGDKKKVTEQWYFSHRFQTKTRKQHKTHTQITNC